ncbi:unnamed protein product, partial [Durusdinium trenchii]
DRRAGRGVRLAAPRAEPGRRRRRGVGSTGDARAAAAADGSGLPAVPWAQQEPRAFVEVPQQGSSLGRLGGSADRPGGRSTSTPQAPQNAPGGRVAGHGEGAAGEAAEGRDRGHPARGVPSRSGPLRPREALRLSAHRGALRPGRRARHALQRAPCRGSSRCGAESEAGARALGRHPRVQLQGGAMLGRGRSAWVGVSVENAVEMGGEDRTEGQGGANEARTVERGGRNLLAMASNLLVRTEERGGRMNVLNSLNYSNCCSRTTRKCLKGLDFVEQSDYILYVPRCARSPSPDHRRIRFPPLSDQPISANRTPCDCQCPSSEQVRRTAPANALVAGAGQRERNRNRSLVGAAVSQRISASTAL